VSTPVSKIVCPNCRSEHDPETNFCGRCGSDLRMRVSAVRQAVADAPSEAGPDPVDPLIGRLIDSRYRVMSRLGHGGMGIVYKVEHQRMGKIAAMKVLHRELVADKEVVKRFRREAEAVSKLTHPNTVQTFDFGTADGAMYLVMEYVRGEDLGTILKRDGAVAFRRAAPIFIQICGALTEAHELGIVHRDLKPENILVTRTKDGQDHVKVLDFGLAKLSEREEAAEVTGRGTIIGTPYYMSPEQIRGEVLDHRSDIYSLGAMMYRVLTGEHPFHAQTPVGVLTKHLTDDVVPPTQRRPDLEIDLRVEQIVLRAMAKKREARYASVDALGEELERVLGELRGASGRMEAISERGSAPMAAATRGMRATTGGTGAAEGTRATGPTGSPVRMAAVVEERRKRDDASGAEPRLAREDFDAFERSLRRRGVARMLIVPLALAAVAAGVLWYVRWQRAQPNTVEKERNNTLETATLIASGTPATGKIGRRIDDNQSDRDYYRVRAPAGLALPAKLTVELSPIKRMDLALAVYDVSGKLLGAADNLGRGDPEVIPNLGVSADEVYVAVMESKYVTDGPTENPTDRYRIQVTFQARADDEEHEPNDVDTDATTLAPERAMRGWPGRHHDADRYRFTGAAGRWEIELAGAEGVPLAIRAGEAEPTSERRLQVDLAPGAVIVVERRDPQEQAGVRPTVAGVDAAYTLVVRAIR
jgi:serine/threonine-protein kinase